ncbi:hypothetical protein [Novosphingobium sp. P6W]|uniref:hypothetical protein n=1 Tax=Novosphingobium sp. P6W TaxID=1609758 RepID=UPI000A68BED4|nr:hypothetical protein [Novosphingobium sp. P6W]
MRISVSDAMAQLTDLVRRAEAVRSAAAGEALPGANAAASQDFLYGEEGIPG